MNDLSRPNYRSFLLPILVSSAFFGLLLGCIAPELIPIFVLTYLLVGLAWFLCMKYLVIGSAYRSIGSKGMMSGTFLSTIALTVLAFLYMPPIEYFDVCHVLVVLFNVAVFIAKFILIPLGIFVISFIYSLIISQYFAGRFDRETERYHNLRNPKPVISQIHQPQANTEPIVWAIPCGDNACRDQSVPVQ